MLLSTPSSSQKHPRNRDAFWFNTFYGCMILFLLASAVGGGVIGGIIGLMNWLEVPRTYGLGYWVGTSALTGAVWMMILGVIIGLVVFVVVALVSQRWLLPRKWRFARSLKLGFFFPLVAAAAIIPPVVIFCMRIIFGPQAFLWGDSLMCAEMLTLVLVPLPLAGRLMYLSKSSRPQRQIVHQRLLPLD